MVETKLDVVGCGSMVVDLFYRTPRIIRADEKILLRSHTASAAIERTEVGGLVLNHLGWGRVLGLKTGIFGKLGDDRNGEFLREGMDRLGIRHHLTFDGSASAFATIFVDAAGDRAIYMARGATGELTPAEVRNRHGAFIRRASLVSTEVSQLPLRTVLAILLFARTHSIPTILDLDVPPSDAIGSLGTRAELERALKLATYLKPAKAAAREIVTGNGRDPLKMAEAILHQAWKSRGDNHRGRQGMLNRGARHRGASAGIQGEADRFDRRGRFIFGGSIRGPAPGTPVGKNRQACQRGRSGRRHPARRVSDRIRCA